MAAFEFGLLLYAAFKARHNRSAIMPPAADIIEAAPLIAMAAVAPPKKRKRNGKRG